MKALVKSRAEQGLWLEDIEEPTVGINDVLIRVDSTGICGTDRPYLPVGRMGAKNHSGTHDHWA